MKMQRRNFLKMLALLPIIHGKLPRAMSWRESPQTTIDAPNVLILVFDTLSAQHASIYGYARQTTPNLVRFAERATVYHTHHSPGNYTNPGTASLLTGTYPWTHRSMQLFSPISEPHIHKNIFAAFTEKPYFSIAYSHNLIVVTLLYQCLADLDILKKARDLCLYDPQISDKLFFNDYDIAIWRERLFRGSNGLPTMPTSLFYYSLNRILRKRRQQRLSATYQEMFPRGLPAHSERLFLLEDAINWLIQNLAQFSQPYLGYFHFSPPHAPYNTRREFIGRFNDGWNPQSKPEHFFTEGHSQETLNQHRILYDEYIAYVDAEFGRLYDDMQQKGILDNTYVIVTSDHGEMFERGIWAHETSTLYDPIVRVPLLISRPGQQKREDIFTPTSSIDLLPTLLHQTGQTIPDWCEGEILPPFRNTPVNSERSIFMLEAKSNAKAAPLTLASFAMVKGQHKLIHYRGYQSYENEYELYELKNDPEEREDLYASQKRTAADLTQELETKIEAVNQPYIRHK